MDFIRQSLAGFTHRLSSLSVTERPTTLDLPVIHPAAVSLEANDPSLGSDYIIGAPHGNAALFQQAVRLLSPHDRLFVCGNIVNRAPQSWMLINYIKEQQSAGINIHLVRGNHENMVLKALENWDAVTETESAISRVSILKTTDRMIQARDMEEKVLYLQEIKDSKLNAYLLIDGERLIWTMPINSNSPIPNSRTDIRHQEKIKHLVSTYGYTTNTVNIFQRCIQGQNYPYSKQTKEELYKALFHPNSGKRNFFAQFSSGLYSLILNGGAWVIDLSNTDREQVINFIRPLPYLIRVENQFDCVCAAPPEESVIQRLLLSGTQPSQNEINYMTWAKINTGDTLILPSGRTQYSLRAYTAHNPLYGNTQSIQTYHDWNIIVLNAGTFLSQALLIVNHSSEISFYMAGETKSTNETKSLQEVVNMIQAYLRHDLNRLTSTTTALLNWEQAHRATNQPTLSDLCIALEIEDTGQPLSSLQSLNLAEMKIDGYKKINWHLYRDPSAEGSDEEEAEGNHRPTSNSST